MNKPPPTPETDALISRMSDDGLDLFEREDELKDHARKLERERDEAQEQLENILNVIPADAPCLHAETGETIADYILGLQKEAGRVHALYFNDKQQLEAMREAFMAAKAFIDCHVADPDTTAEMIKAYTAYQESFRKLQPFLKP